MWVGFISLMIRTSRAVCEHGNETSGYLKCGEFLESHNNCYLLNDSCLLSYLANCRYVS